MKSRLRLPGAALVALLAVSLASVARSDEQPTVKVFILAGQSNMEGKAKNELYDYQAEAPATKPLFAHLRRDGQWIVRDDVFIKFLDRKGPLTLGYGSPGRTGLELQFGTVMGDHFEEPVLLIKTAWGGHSLFQNFRPPSAGLPSDDYLQEELRKSQANVRTNNERRNRNDPLPTMETIKARYGQSYRDMLQEVRDVMANYAMLFPTLRDKQLELAGFVWFQGFNDQWGDAPAEYEANLKHFIRDVRRDLEAPQLPFVIGALGQTGSKPAEGGHLAVRTAQLAMNAVPEFEGNVKAIRTDVLVDEAAERLYPHWKERFEEWQKTGSDRPYHYLGSAIWFNRIGQALAEAMLQLRAE